MPPPSGNQPPSSANSSRIIRDFTNKLNTASTAVTKLNASFVQFNNAIINASANLMAFSRALGQVATAAGGAAVAKYAGPIPGQPAGAAMQAAPRGRQQQQQPLLVQLAPPTSNERYRGKLGVAQGVFRGVGDVGATVAGDVNWARRGIAELSGLRNSLMAQALSGDLSLSQEFVYRKKRSDNYMAGASDLNKDAHDYLIQKLGLSKKDPKRDKLETAEIQARALSKELQIKSKEQGDIYAKHSNAFQEGAINAGVWGGALGKILGPLTAAAQDNVGGVFSGLGDVASGFLQARNSAQGLSQTLEKNKLIREELEQIDPAIDMPLRALQQNFYNKAEMYAPSEYRAGTTTGLVDIGAMAGLSESQGIQTGLGIFNRFGGRFGKGGGGMGESLYRFGARAGAARGVDVGMTGQLAGMAGIGIGESASNADRASRGIEMMTKAMAEGIKRGFKDPQTAEALMNPLARISREVGGDASTFRDLLLKNLNAANANPEIIAQRARGIEAGNQAFSSNPYFKSLALKIARQELGDTATIEQVQMMANLSGLDKGGELYENQGFTATRRKAMKEKIMGAMLGTMGYSMKDLESKKGILNVMTTLQQGADKFEDLSNNELYSWLEVQAQEKFGVGAKDIDPLKGGAGGTAAWTAGEKARTSAKHARQTFEDEKTGKFSKEKWEDFQKVVKTQAEASSLAASVNAMESGVDVMKKTLEEIQKLVASISGNKISTASTTAPVSTNKNNQTSKPTTTAPSGPTYVPPSIPGWS